MDKSNEQRFRIERDHANREVKKLRDAVALQASQIREFRERIAQLERELAEARKTPV